ncbi:Vacuolar amino acid transporter 2 [Globisporangium polare]
MFVRRTEAQQQLGQEKALFHAKEAERQQYTTTADVITTATTGRDASAPHLSSSPISAYEDKMADSQRYGSATTSNNSSKYTRKHIIVTFLVLAVLVQIVALTRFINIATVLSVTGGIAGIAMLFVVPAACFLQLAPPHDDNHRVSDSWYLSKCLPWTSILLGVVASIACLIANMVQD